MHVHPPERRKKWGGRNLKGKFISVPQPEGKNKIFDVGVVNLAVLACILRAAIKEKKKGRQLFLRRKCTRADKILATKA